MQTVKTKIDSLTREKVIELFNQTRLIHVQSDHEIPEKE